MSKDTVASNPEVDEALKRARNAGDNGFVVLGLNGNALTVAGEGNGGLAEATANLPEDDARYILLTKVHKVDMSTTTKFVFISYTAESVKPMRKALLSTFLPKISDICKPFHVSFNWTSKAELDKAEKAIQDKIGFTSGTASYIVDSPAPDAKSNKSSVAATKPMVPASIRDDRKMDFDDEAAVNQAIKALRDDNDPTNWLIITYKDKDVNVLTLKGSGSGGLEELQANMDDALLCYGLFRVTETFDKTQRVMFGFFKLLSQTVELGPRQKGIVSTHMGFITKLLQPFHIEFLLDKKAEFTPDLVHNKFQSTMGTKSNVRTDDEVKQLTKSTSGNAVNKPALVPKSALTGSGNAALLFQDEEAFKKAVKDVHADSSPINWVLTSYVAKNTIGVLGTGQGSVEDMMNAFEETNANFGLLRVTEVIDKSVTTKFVYIRWLPESTPYMKKAEITTKKGAIDELFRPFHVDFQISEKKEVSTQIVMDKVSTASGSKSHVQ